MFIHSGHPLCSGTDVAKIHKFNTNQINNAKRDSYTPNIRNKNPNKNKEVKTVIVLFIRTQATGIQVQIERTCSSFSSFSS